MQSVALGVALGGVTKRGVTTVRPPYALHTSIQIKKPALFSSVGYKGIKLFLLLAIV